MILKRLAKILQNNNVQMVLERELIDYNKERKEKVYRTTKVTLAVIVLPALSTNFTATVWLPYHRPW